MGDGPLNEVYGWASVRDGGSWPFDHSAFVRWKFDQVKGEGIRPW